MKLPPNPDGQNDERAARARKVLALYCTETGSGFDISAMGDLLCDLHHLADRIDVDFEQALEMAMYHYDQETKP